MALSHVREIAAEVFRRAANARRAADGVAPLAAGDGEQLIPYVIRVSSPITASETLQLMAARLNRSPIAIMPQRCKTMAEWLYRYGRLAGT